ncbi:hypothetical protein D3C76_1422530 [compost metagenome]
MMVAQQYEPYADDGADQRREQQHYGQCLPAQPGTERSQQLEVAMAHPLLAGQQLERPVEAPEHQIARHGTDHRIGQRHKAACQIEQQTAP